MNIILLSPSRKSPINLSVSRRTVVGALVVIFAVLPLLAGAMGYGIAYVFHVAKPGTAAVANAGGNAELDAGARLDAALADARSGLDALTMKLGELQARVIRLDALGQRLVETAKLDKAEFNFERVPGVGGPEEVSAVESVELPQFLRTLDELTRHIEDREQQLELLDALVMRRTIGEETLPSGRPIAKSGWVSSHFGKRTDPFNGRLAFHAGVDFAGKLNSDVVAVAGGVVTFSGSRHGYGTMVEVDHGNGYVTRYAHNNRNVVKAGDVVEKGQVIAHMGSSGRSTGPHVHFELLHNGKPVDPIKFLRASR